MSKNEVNEHTRLLHTSLRDRRLSHQPLEDASSFVASHVTKEEQALGGSTIGERLKYNDYTTIDWLHVSRGEAMCVLKLTGEHRTWFVSPQTP